jgi:hypothetical protein
MLPTVLHVYGQRYVLAAPARPCRNYRRDRIREWTPAMSAGGCQTGCQALNVLSLDPCPFDADWSAGARTCPCYH